MILTSNAVSGLIFYVVGFSVFDVFGFTASTNNVPEGDGKQDNIFRYRIIQLMMQTFMTVLVWNYCGWSVALAATVAWFFTTCDKLFYIIQKSKYTGDYPWLESWSVFSLLKPLGIKATDKTFNALALGGIILSLVMIFFL